MNKKEHLFLVQKRYFIEISKGNKTIEGRLHKDKYQDIQPGDFCYFSCPEYSDKIICCKIEQKRLYLSFKEMLKNEGLEKCLPKTSSIEEGVSIYHSFPGYESGEKIFGVVAFQILLQPYI